MTNSKTTPRRSPEEVVRALLDKTIERGATEGEESAAVAKAAQLIAKHKLDRSKFVFPPQREVTVREGRRTIRAACEERLRQDPPLGYDEIVAQVRAEFAGSKTTVKCLRYYASKMRLRNVRLPVRPRASRGVGRTTVRAQ